MNFDAVFTVKKEIEKKAFLRQLLVELGKNEDTPVDVVNATMGDVRESFKEVLVCTAFVSGTCTASIGYDRTEPYTDYETYKEKVGDNYVTRQKAVVKYRTVTDWQPYKTDFSGKATYSVGNTEKRHDFRGNATTALKTAAESSIVEEGEAEVNKSALDRALVNCEAHVQVWETKFPGDRKKDERYECTTQVEAVVCYRLPYYEVTFEYRGKKYSAAAFACGKLAVEYDKPEKVAEATTDPVAEIEAKAKQQTEKLEKTNRLAWMVFFGSVGVGALACFLLKFCWLWPVALAVLVYAFLTNKKYNAEYKKSTASLALEHAKAKTHAQANRMRAKIDALNQELTARDYKTLSQTETPVIDEQSEAAIEKNIPKIAPPKSFKKKAILCGLLAIVLMISSFVVNHQVMHSPQQVAVKLVNKTTEYDPDAKPYINGCYYIHLDFEVAAKQIGVRGVALKVFISQKDGTELGYVRASLSSLGLGAGETKTVTVTLNENQPEKNEFFTALYNADMNDLSFEYEIGSINFADGEHYFIDDYNTWTFK